MKLTIQKDQLLKGLQTVQSVVNTSTTLPIITNVLLEADGDKLKLTATDLDVTITCEVEAKVKTAGTTTVSAKKIFGITREFDGDEVEIEVDANSVCCLRSGPSVYRINGLPADEFPPMPKMSGGKTFKLSCEDAKQMFQRTSFAMSTDVARYILNGAMLVASEGSVMTVATDGRRLALASCETEIKKANFGQFILPGKTVAEIARLLQDKGDVEITYTESHASLSLSGKDVLAATVLTKLVEGSFPNYKQIIPEKSAERVGVKREEILRALRRAEIMINEKSASVKLAFGKNKLTISANAPEIGDATEDIVLKYKGKEMAIAVNPKYLIDPLSALEDAEVFFEMNDDISPVVVKVNGPFLYVVSPMRLQ